MSNNFFGKLSHLAKSYVNDIIDPMSDDERTSRSRRQALARNDIQGNLQDDVKTLRQRVNDALDHEDKLQSRVNDLYDEAADFDRQADAAVQSGDEMKAREYIGRVQQIQKEITMIEADLQEHRYITQEFISQVNTLEGALADADANNPVSQQQQPQSADEKSQVEQLGETIAKQLDSTRRQLSDLISNYTQQSNVTNIGMGERQPPEEYKPERPRRSRSAGQAPQTSQPPKQSAPQQPQRNVSHPVDRRKVDDDYSARLSRLSKPDKDDKK